MGSPKIDPVELKRLLDQGKSTSECAEHFGVTPSAISMRKRDLNVKTTAVVAMEHAHSLVENQLDVMGQLRKANEEVNFLLDMLTGALKGDPESIETLERSYEFGEKFGKNKISPISYQDPVQLALKCAQEIRQQNRFAFEIAESIYNITEQEKARAIIIEEIGKASPVVRAAIVRRLQQRRLLRESTRITR